MFTKQHYEVVAKVLQDVASDPVQSNGYSRAALGAIEEEFINVFSKDNSSFDPVRFRAASKGEAT